MVKIIGDKRISGGSPVIKGTRIRVVDIGIEFEYLGKSPDEIVKAHPHLSLADVHAALAYFYDHITELRDKIKKDSAFIKTLQEEYSRKRAVIAQ